MTQLSYLGFQIVILRVYIICERAFADEG